MTDENDHGRVGDTPVSGSSAEIRANLIGTWYRSSEEDDGETIVYRSPTFPFRPSRAPRESIEFLEDGSMLSGVGGADDRAVTSPGNWSYEAHLRISSDTKAQVFDIEWLDAEQLVLRLRFTEDPFDGREEGSDC